MPSDAVSELFADFPELAEGGIYWEKELFVHFGLLFSAYALLEAGLQNIFIVGTTLAALRNHRITSEAEYEMLQADLEEKAVGSTFGSLLRLADQFLKYDALREEIRSLKRQRDYFAHHFFREENPQMLAGRYVELIGALNRQRRRVKAAEDTCDVIGKDLLGELFPHSIVDEKLRQASATLRTEAISLAEKKAVFGWEDL